MPERGEMVSFSTATSRVRYGKAETDKATNCPTYQDMITLTGAIEDFSDANLKDIGTNKLSQGGAHYFHSTGEIWVCPNMKDGEVYRVTGINENSWKIEKLLARVFSQQVARAPTVALLFSILIKRK